MKLVGAWMLLNALLAQGLARDRNLGIEEVVWDMNKIVSYEQGIDDATNEETMDHTLNGAWLQPSGSDPAVFELANNDSEWPYEQSSVKVTCPDGYDRVMSESECKSGKVKIDGRNLPFDRTACWTSATEGCFEYKGKLHFNDCTGKEVNMAQNHHAVCRRSSDHDTLYRIVDYYNQCPSGYEPLMDEFTCRSGVAQNGKIRPFAMNQCRDDLSKGCFSYDGDGKNHFNTCNGKYDSPEKVHRHPLVCRKSTCPW